jgi:hypothetical protein
MRENTQRLIHGLRANSALSKVETDPVAKRIRQQSDLVRQKAKEAVESNANLLNMRHFSRILLDRYGDVSKAFQAVDQDRYLTAEGKRAAKIDLQEKLEAGVTEALAEYNAWEDSFIGGYPETTNEWKLTGDDVNRVSYFLSLAGADGDPVVLLEHMEDALEADDRAVVAALRGPLTQLEESEKIRHAPAETRERFGRAVRLAKDTSVLHRNGWRQEARKAALETAQRLRTQVEDVAGTFLEGSDVDLATSISGYEAVIRQSGLVRGDGQPGGAWADLHPVVAPEPEE